MEFQTHFSDDGFCQVNDQESIDCLWHGRGKRGTPFNFCLSQHQPLISSII
ncbi:hypothetical protein D082_23240 [Synechocystis sp. PCC 6714]|nr:hypothetical protein D082_23240 [Synechocystis sp. PCC 6714]